MKRSDLTTARLLQAVADHGVGAFGELVQDFPAKVVYAAVERDTKQGFLSWGVSPTYPWLEDKGRDYLRGLAEVGQCAATLSRCRCVGAPGHDVGDAASPHSCPCGGSWVGVDGAAGFEIRSYPEQIISPEDGEALGPIDVVGVLASSMPSVRRGGVRFEDPGR